MKTASLCTLLFLALCFISPATAYYGTRPMGMGGAFTAIADDANAAYWNPAGFAFNPGVDIAGTALLSNRNSVMGDNLFAAKFCYDAPMSSPFEWIMGVTFLTSIGMDIAEFLGEQGVLKKNWGRNVTRTSREESMADQVNAGGGETGHSRNPFADENKTPKQNPDRIIQRNYGPLNFNFNFFPQSHTYWGNRWADPDPEKTPLKKAQFALGLTWMYDNNPVLDENRNWYSVSVASGWEERIAVGANLNIYDLRVISSGIKGFGAGVDLGAIAKPLPNVSIGMTAKEILTTDIAWQNGVKTRYEMLINGGIAIDPIEKMTIAADVHNAFAQNNARATMHYGVELRPVFGLALRGGLSDNSKTAGLSLGTGNVILDYAYLGGEFARTQMAGITWKF